MRVEVIKRAEATAAEADLKMDLAFRNAAERIGPDLVAAVRKVEALYTFVAAAQMHVDSRGAARARELGTIVHFADWGTLRIPSSEGIASLRAHTRMVTFRPVLAGGDPEGLWKAANVALDEARAEIRCRLQER
jgi:hypothetical protein